MVIAVIKRMNNKKIPKRNYAILYKKTKYILRLKYYEQDFCALK